MDVRQKLSKFMLQQQLKACLLPGTTLS